MHVCICQCISLLASLSVLTVLFLSLSLCLSLSLSLSLSLCVCVWANVRAEGRDVELEKWDTVYEMDWIRVRHPAAAYYIPAQVIVKDDLVLCWAGMGCAMPCRVVLCYAVPCCAVPCCVVLCCAVLCSAMLCAMLCRAMLCRSALCDAMRCWVGEVRLRRRFCFDWFPPSPAFALLGFVAQNEKMIVQYEDQTQLITQEILIKDNLSKDSAVRIALFCFGFSFLPSSLFVLVSCFLRFFRPSFVGSSMYVSFFC